MKELLSRMQKLNIPFDATFELTYNCNLKCVHCYQDNQNTDVLTTKEILDVLVQLRELKCINLAFTGGEIFTRKDIFEILDKAYELDFALRLFTNATLIDESIANKLAKYQNRIQFVEISIYGATKEIHDRITSIEGSFEKTIQAIKFLKKNNIEVLAKTPVMTLNKDELNDIIELCKNIGIKHSKSMLMYPTINRNNSPVSYRLNRSEILKILRDDINKDINDKDKIRQKFNRFVSPENYNEKVCGAATRIINITPMGDITPCIILPHKLGNIRDYSLYSIWNELSDIIRFRNDIKNICNEKCKSCTLSRVCSKCIGLSYLENGSFDSHSSNFCDIMESSQKVVQEVL